MSKHKDCLQQGHFPEHDSIKEDGCDNDGRSEQGSLLGMDRVVRIGKHDDGLDLLTRRITCTCKRGVPGCQPRTQRYPTVYDRNFWYSGGATTFLLSAIAR